MSDVGQGPTPMELMMERVAQLKADLNEAREQAELCCAGQDDLKKESDALRADLADEREGRQDAIRQIAKARDERAAIQQKADDEFASMSEQLNTFVCERVKIMAERDTARAELAAERRLNARQEAKDCSILLAATRAELAAEKKEAEIQFEAREADIRDIRNLGIARQKAEAERDALRELLRELWSKQDLRFYDDEYLARIDAALKGDGNGSE